MEDGDDAGSYLPAVDDLSNDETEGSCSSEESGRRRGYGDQDVLQQGTKAPLARFAHIVNRICVRAWWANL